MKNIFSSFTTCKCGHEFWMKKKNGVGEDLFIFLAWELANKCNNKKVKHLCVRQYGILLRATNWKIIEFQLIHGRIFITMQFTCNAVPICCLLLHWNKQWQTAQPRQRWVCASAFIVGGHIKPYYLVCTRRLNCTRFNCCQRCCRSRKYPTKYIWHVSSMLGVYEMVIFARHIISAICSKARRQLHILWGVIQFTWKWCFFFCVAHFLAQLALTDEWTHRCGRVHRGLQYSSIQLSDDID